MNRYLILEPFQLTGVKKGMLLINNEITNIIGIQVLG